MKKLSLFLLVFLLFPLSSALAFTWTSPLAPELGTPGNPLRVQITNYPKTPTYCNYLPSFFARWSQFSECSQQVVQRTLQTNLLQLNRNIEEQNRIAREAQQRQFINSLRAPVYVAPAPVTYDPPQTNAIYVDNSNTRSNDQWCKDDYGPYSIWDGTLNNTGGPVCGCSAGYDFSDVVNRCVPVTLKDGGCDANGCWGSGGSGGSNLD